MDNSRILGVLKRTAEEKEARVLARELIEAYLQSQEGLITLDVQKAAKQKEITDLESKKQGIVADREKAQFEHRREMEVLAKERDGLRGEIDMLRAEAAAVRGSVEQAVNEKQAHLAGYENKIADAQKVLQRIKDEIDALKKKFAA